MTPQQAIEKHLQENGWTQDTNHPIDYTIHKHPSHPQLQVYLDEDQLVTIDTDKLPPHTYRYQIKHYADPTLFELLDTLTKPEPIVTPTQ